eukprot:Em0011g1030a
MHIQIKRSGILTGYTVYDHSLPTFPPTTTSAGDINNLNPNGVYQFSVVAQMTITGQLYSGEMDTSLVNTPTITPGSSNLVSTSYWGGVLAGLLVTEFVVLAVAMVIIAGSLVVLSQILDWKGLETRPINTNQQVQSWQFKSPGLYG